MSRSNTFSMQSLMATLIAAAGAALCGTAFGAPPGPVTEQGSGTLINPHAYLNHGNGGWGREKLKINIRKHIDDDEYGESNGGNADSTDEPPAGGIEGTTRPSSNAAGAEKVMAAQTMIEKNIAATSTFMTFSNALNPPASTTTQPASECATAPHERGTTPLVSVSMPSPDALVSAAVTPIVQMTR